MDAGGRATQEAKAEGCRRGAYDVHECTSDAMAGRQRAATDVFTAFFQADTTLVLSIT